MWKSISSLVRFTKKQVDSAKKAISKYAGQVINLVPEPIRRTVNTVTGNLMTKINEIFENKKKLPPNAVEESSLQQEVATRPYQCGIAVYQLAKLRMLEFYYDFLDKFCDRRDFELIQMDTDSFYVALSANDFDDIIRPELKELYKEEKKNWLVTDEYSKEFQDYLNRNSEEKE